LSSKPEGYRQQEAKNRTMAKLAKNLMQQTQKTYPSTYNYSHTYSTRRSSRNYWNDENGIMK